jgi:hypothetical protein
MRIIPKYPVWIVTCMLFAMLAYYFTTPSKAETTTISIGPWTFEDQAFADNATDLSGIHKIRVEGVVSCGVINETNFQECLDLALTGHSPNIFLVNVGTTADSESNHYQLDFTDLKAVNNFGADIVFFECRFGPNSYEFAVRPEGGDFTDFLTYPASAFQETDSLCSDPFTNWGLPIDLTAFGLPSGTVVNALQFKVVDPDPFDPSISAQGEPSMAAVLSNPPGGLYLPIIVR